ncbi:DUF1028 domain-containing protein [Maribacter sp.]|nr:DUF1028 domain-containing protein [Maribacter sp.]
MNYANLFLLFLFGIIYNANSQNIPSLVLDKNINATFSIVAYDADEQEWGIAVATNNIYVGNSTMYIEPGVGAFSVIAETEPMYGIKGLAQLKQGLPIEEAIEITRSNDEASHYRQVSGIDSEGNVYAFTGEDLKYWKGTATHQYGAGYVVMGNQLADGVLSEMAQTYEAAKGTLAERLLESLKAGQKAGGQVSGKQSAALAVRGSDHEWFNQIDLRVDNSKTPFDDLQVLLNYHYGRIRVNQTIYAARMNNQKRAEALMQEAESLTNGWSGMYSKIALAHSLMGNEDKAVTTIKKALDENPKWQSVLPAFYFLKDHPKMKNLIHADTFSVKDWNNAIMVMIELKKVDEAVQLAESTLKTYPDSSYTHYLLGKALRENGALKSAQTSLETALQIDAENMEAQKMLQNLND